MLSASPFRFLTGSGQLMPRLARCVISAEKERQVALGDALLIQRQDEIAGRAVQQEVGILDALGDALVGQQFAEIVGLEEFRKLVGGDVGVNRHRDYSAASGRSDRGSGKNSFSSAAETVSTCNS